MAAILPAPSGARPTVDSYGQMRTRFILIQPSHAGNVGAAARAIKVMGFSDLVLVAPRWPDVLARPEAIERASGATDVLAAARIVATLDEALDGVAYLCATVMTPRDFGPPTFAPREHLGTVAATQESVAFLFGSERYGMRNEDVYRCHAALRIPTDPAYGSLNLAAALQVIAYEWRSCLGGAGVIRVRAEPVEAPAGPSTGSGRTATGAQRAAPADAQAVAGMLAHWEQALADIGFLDPAAPKKLMPRLNQLFNRAQPTPEEVHILRGIAKAMSLARRGPKA
jgi:tRNA/rRNA methyltransferase